MLALATARVRDAVVRPPFFVDGAQDIVSVCRALAAAGLTTALVREADGAGPARLGIFTTTDLRDALLRGTPPERLAVREVARFPVLEVQAEAELFEALWAMVRHRVHRLVVRDGERVLGVLGQLDLMNFVANHSHLIGVQIEEAATVAELAAAAARVDEMVRLLHGSGIRIARVTHLVSELNRRLVARAWALAAAPELVRGSCLLVLGSEGRGEQIVKTDQDNALVLRDGLDARALDVAGATARLAAALGELGWPPCPGGIMASRPAWCRPLAAWREAIRQWLYGHEPEAPMQLAIFVDATAVAGDAALLDALRTHLDQALAGADAFLARFAAAADQFHEPGGWFTRLKTARDDRPLDIKKLGIFPIVHGVRALALQQRLHVSGTVPRLRALVAAGQFDAAQADDLVDALHLLMGIRLAHQLRQRAAGRPAGNEVRPAELATLEREPLRDALDIVKDFRQWLRRHFRFDAL
ncbi:MAG: CBS domain-containing protein [Comamonadaceae bacterium]|nr:CBS domain-containing protein [Rubrivivax sp.]NLZ42987.1 CBS domain-containing protein [Comamonadaceae bacterium]